MDSLTNICRMLSGNNIYVPNYQRAYSWDTEFDLGKTARQVNTFLIDLQDYIESKSASRYYFGHFLKKEKRFLHFLLDRMGPVWYYTSRSVCRHTAAAIMEPMGLQRAPVAQVDRATAF